MPLSRIILPVFIFFCFSQSQEKSDYKKDRIDDQNIQSNLNKEVRHASKILKDRFLPPKGYKRIQLQENSFGHYLRHLPLKSDTAFVKYYNGAIKSKEGVYAAVVDLEIGNKNLHQCADAIMRLRAEYWWKQKKYDKIHFNFTNGFTVEYTEWMKGKRMVIEGNKTYWKMTDDLSDNSKDYEDFWEYMELIFMYAGTASLEKEMKAVSINEMQIGDVFIQGGHPGHAVVVVDMAVDPDNQEKVFMLAQSYMPAQETQILINPQDPEKGVWYNLDSNQVNTPEWKFESTQLKRFSD